MRCFLCNRPGQWDEDSASFVCDRCLVCQDCKKEVGFFRIPFNTFLCDNCAETRKKELEECDFPLFLDEGEEEISEMLDEIPWEKNYLDMETDAEIIHVDFVNKKRV